MPCLARRRLARAFRQLRGQYVTEFDFGWHDRDAVWRKRLRELYPIDYVAARHRALLGKDDK